MFLSRILFSRTSVLAGLVVAGLLWTVQPASAQQAPYAGVSKFDRANAGAAPPGAYYAPWYAPRAPAPVQPAPQVAAMRPAYGSLLVTVQGPTAVEPVYVTLRGPDGEVQRFPLESGSASIQTRGVIVRQGDAATFHFVVAARSK